ncbi:MAG: hypothetical protein AAB922_04355 [Patescibacteria group bacterium]
MITKKDVQQNLETVKKYIQELENEVEWVDITYKNCPTLAKYGAVPFRIMKKKMRKPRTQKVWNNINFFDAQKEAKNLGYRLPDIREMLALLEQYRVVTKTPNYKDKEFLGIGELSYDEDVYLEWIDVAGVAARRGGSWGVASPVGPFSLFLGGAPSFVGGTVGFRMCSTLKSDTLNTTKKRR